MRSTNRDDELRLFSEKTPSAKLDLNWTVLRARPGFSDFPSFSLSLSLSLFLPLALTFSFSLFLSRFRGLAPFLLRAADGPN